MQQMCDLTYETERFEEHLDRAVDEVFRTMVGVPCMPIEEAPRSGRATVTAVIGLAGAMSGAIVLHCGTHAAKRIAERMTGVASLEADALVRDAVGEVCNMVAGAWKGFDSVLCAGCLLSTPTVVAGTSYELFSDRAPLHIERCYRFEEFVFMFTIFCEANQ